MATVVETDTSNSANIREGKRREQRDYFGGSGCYFVVAKDVTCYDISCLCLGNVIGTLWKNGIAVVDTSIVGKKSNETLQIVSELLLAHVSYPFAARLTEN